VEVDKADKAPVEQAAVTEVYIRGWKVDDVMMVILAECFPAVTSLHTVDLWNVGLSDVTLAKLASTVPRCRALRSLTLDANPVSSQCWHLLLQVDYQLPGLYCIIKVGVINIHEVINIHGNMPPSIRGFSTAQCKKPIINNNTTRQK